jgi:hypothetical protein
MMTVSTGVGAASAALGFSDMMGLIPHSSAQMGRKL